MVESGEIGNQSKKKGGEQQLDRSLGNTLAALHVGRRKLLEKVKKKKKMPLSVITLDLL